MIVVECGLVSPRLLYFPGRGVGGVGSPGRHQLEICATRPRCGGGKIRLRSVFNQIGEWTVDSQISQTRTIAVVNPRGQVYTSNGINLKPALLNSEAQIAARVSSESLKVGVTRPAIHE